MHLNKTGTKNRGFILQEDYFSNLCTKRRGIRYILTEDKYTITACIVSGNEYTIEKSKVLIKKEYIFQQQEFTYKIKL